MSSSRSSASLISSQVGLSLIAPASASHPAEASSCSWAQRRAPSCSLSPGAIVWLLSSPCSSSSGLPTGYLDRLSGMLLRMPGTWKHTKRYLVAFSAKFLRRGLSISARHFSSEYTPTSGLWSTPMRSFFAPIRKCFPLSKPQATARASPSIGEYLLSAGEQNLLFA